MATPQDAELILKLYQLRTEPTMREARKFVATFNPATIDELLTLQRDSGSQNNAYWRQATSYWEMASSFVLRGALDDELFADCCAEALFYYGKFSPLHQAYKDATGQPFMRHTALLVEKSPAVAARYAIFLKRFQPKS
jgi:hypothetical protein